MTSRNKRKEIFLVFVFPFLASVLSITLMQKTVSFEQDKAIWLSTGNAEDKAAEETCIVLNVHLKYLVAQNTM